MISSQQIRGFLFQQFIIYRTRAENLLGLIRHVGRKKLKKYFRKYDAEERIGEGERMLKKTA
jgi:hypothetical protein